MLLKISKIHCTGNVVGGRESRNKKKNAIICETNTEPVPKTKCSETRGWVGGVELTVDFFKVEERFFRVFVFTSCWAVPGVQQISPLFQKKKNRDIQALFLLSFLSLFFFFDGHAALGSTGICGPGLSGVLTAPLSLSLSLSLSTVQCVCACVCCLP